MLQIRMFLGNLSDLHEAVRAKFCGPQPLMTGSLYQQKHQ